MAEPAPERVPSDPPPRRRVLIDHCVPRQLMRPLAGDPVEFDVARVGALGLAAVDDGPLLDRIEGRCDVFATMDKRLPKQQRLEGRPFGTVAIPVPSRKLPAELWP